MNILENVRTTGKKIYLNNEGTSFSGLRTEEFCNESDRKIVEIRFKLINIAPSSFYMGSANMQAKIQDIETDSKYTLSKSQIPELINRINEKIMLSGNSESGIVARFKTIPTGTMLEFVE